MNINSKLYGIFRVSDLNTKMDDQQLDAMVTEILQHHPNTGYKMMIGYLNSRGIKIQSKFIIVYL